MLTNTLTREHLIDLYIALDEMGYVARHLASLESVSGLENVSLFELAKSVEDLADHAARAVMRVDALCDRLPSPDSLDAILPSN